ncbi:MAG: FapA family protein [Lachnospiraceae bacterium]|nr:FapA family protein [Lachnospiraceae bacterium]
MAYNTTTDTDFSLNAIVVDVSRDSLEAFVNVISDGKYLLSETELYEFLYAYELDKERLKKDVITEIVDLQRYNEEVVIAEGIPAIDGTDGYFEYFFNQVDKNTKPLILADGSVDYSSVNYIGTVSTGDKIAVYHPPVPGKPGVTVYGQTIKPREGRDLPVPGLKNCIYKPETKTFYALKDGRVNASKTKIEVIEEVEINKNINVAYGNVDFIGNVIINGDVEEGVTIHASSDVKISGLVQSSNIYAGGDIIIEGGILGGGNCKIECGGNLKAKFIEHANVTAHNNIEANYILSSMIFAGNNINVTEGVGSISGGVNYGGFEINANKIGNRQRMDTKVSTGKLGNEDDRAKAALTLLDETRKSIPLIIAREDSLQKVENKTDDIVHKIQVIKRELLAELIKQSTASTILANTNRQLDPNRDACYIKAETLFAGVTAFIDMKQYPVTFDQSEIVLKSEDKTEEENAVNS